MSGNQVSPRWKLVFLALLFAGCATYACHTLHAPYWQSFLHAGPMVDRFPGTGEALLYALVFGFGGIVSVSLLVVLGELKPRFVGWVQRVTVRPSDRMSMLLPAVFAALATRLIWHFVTHGAWFTDDESAYAFQAKLYAEGQLSGSLLQPEVLFGHQFVVEVAPDSGVRQRTGVYPILQPLLMAGSSVFGDMHLSQALAVGVITYNTGRLAQSLFRDLRQGVMAAWLCAISPCLLGLGATYHTSILATALSVVSVRLLLFARDGTSVLHGVVLGLVTGAIFLTRPLDGALMASVVGAALVWRCWPERHVAGRLLPCVGFGLGGLVSLLVYIGVNLCLTGEPLRSAYSVLEEQVGSFFGFGPHRMFGREHTPWLATIQTCGALIRLNTWLFGWPSCLLLWVLSLHPAVRSPATCALMALSMVQLAAYSTLAFGSVHDFGSAYHVWHTPWIACVTASVLCRGANKLIPSLRQSQTAVWQLVAALTATGWVLFWPIELARVANVAAAIVGPVTAARQAVGEQRALVLWRDYPPPGPRRTWVLLPPVAHPRDQIVWARHNDALMPLLRQNHPDRAFYQFSWANEQPKVVPYAPLRESKSTNPQ